MTNQWFLLVIIASSIVMTIRVSVHCGVTNEPDYANLEIDGDGKFNMELTQFKRIRDMWKELTDETDKVETPRPIGGDDSSRVNVNMYDKIIIEQERVKRGENSDNVESEGNKSNNGLLHLVSRTDQTRRISEELYEWIQRRAESIAHKYESYADELNNKDNRMNIGKAIVTHILLLNTFVDLDNLVKEKFDNSFKSAVWIKKKLDNLKERYELSLAAVKGWLEERFREVEGLERKLRETNYEWVANMRDIKRFMHEQRFSDELDKKCVDFLKGEWQGYDRAYRLELFKDE